MPLAQLILSALNVTIPQVVRFITIIRHKDGSATVLTELSEAAMASEETKKMVADWNASHPTA